MSNLNLEPLYTHDCDACRFLYQDGDMDMYWCSSGGQGGSIIARMSSDPVDYASAPVSTVIADEINTMQGIALRKAAKHLVRTNMIRIYVHGKTVAEWDEAHGRVKYDVNGNIILQDN